MRIARQTLVVGTAFLSLGGLVACQPATTEDAAAPAPQEAVVSGPDLTSNEAKASYTAGFSMANQIVGQFGDMMDGDAFQAGIADRLSGADSAVSQEDAQAAMTTLGEAQRAKDEAKGAANGQAGAEFLKANAEKEGVVTTDSGLQYLVMTEGSGPKPKATDTVTTHYEGKLLDGTIFDSSVSRGQPASFPLNRVIRGWTEGLQLMSVGSKYRFFIPSELAYGSRGTGGIPPQSTLIFEVELLEIQGADAQ